MAFKIFCNKCGAEFSSTPPTSLKFFVGKIVETKITLLQPSEMSALQLPQGKGPAFLDQTMEKTIHLCSSCLIEFEKFLEK